MLGTPVAPAAASLTLLYSPSINTKGDCSQVLCCNIGSNSDKVRVALSSGNDTTVGAAEWVAYDVPLARGETLPVVVADTIPFGYAIVVYSLLGTTSFRACGDSIDV